MCTYADLVEVKMYGLYDNFARILRDMTRMDALAKIARRDAINGMVGRATAERAKSKMHVARNSFNVKRIQVANRNMAVLRHRTHR